MDEIKDVLLCSVDKPVASPPPADPPNLSQENTCSAAEKAVMPSFKLQQIEWSSNELNKGEQSMAIFGADWF